jgi:hypothetical protein
VHHVVDLPIHEPSCVYAFSERGSFTAIVATYNSLLFIVQDDVIKSSVTISCPGLSIGNCNIEMRDASVLYILTGFYLLNCLGMRDGWVTLHHLVSGTLEILDSRNIGELPVSFTRHDSNHIVTCTDDFTCMISIQRGLIRVDPIDGTVDGFSSLVPFSNGLYLSQFISTLSIRTKTPSSFSLLFTFPTSSSERPLQIAHDESTGLIILTSTSRILACSSSGSIVAHLLLPQEGSLSTNP